MGSYAGGEPPASGASLSLQTEGELDRELRLQSALNDKTLELAELQAQHLRLTQRSQEARSHWEGAMQAKEEENDKLRKRIAELEAQSRTGLQALDQERDRSVLLGTYLDHVREAVRRAVALAPEVHSDDLGEAVTRLIHWAETRHAAARKYKAMVREKDEKLQLLSQSLDAARVEVDVLRSRARDVDEEVRGVVERARSGEQAATSRAEDLEGRLTAAVARAEDAERRCRKVEGREESVREEVAELQRLLREAEIGTAQRRRRDSESGAKARGLSAEVDELRMRLLEQERRNRMLAERCESLTIEQARAEAELEGFKRARRAHRHSADEDACCKHRMKDLESRVSEAQAELGRERSTRLDAERKVAILAAELGGRKGGRKGPCCGCNRDTAALQARVLMLEQALKAKSKVAAEMRRALEAASREGADAREGLEQELAAREAALRDAEAKLCHLRTLLQGLSQPYSGAR